MLIGHVHVFFWEMVIQILFPFWIGLFLFLLLSFRSSLYILDSNPLSDIWFTNISFHSVGCLFSSLMVSFDAQHDYILMKFSLSVISFVPCPLVSYPRKHCQIQCHETFVLFSFKSFIVLGLTFRFLTHFELMFEYGIR